MRKFLLSAVALAASSAIAAPVGNPSFPELLEEGYFIPAKSPLDLRAGYEGDFICDARMRQEEEGHGHVDSYKQDTNSGIVTINFLDRVDFYGVFGSSRVCSDWRFTDVDRMVNRVQMETSYHFLWSVGGRGILLKWGKTVCGVGARYNHSSLKPTWTTINGVPIPTGGTNLHWREWQVDFDLSHQIEIFVPYIGVKYSNARTKLGNYSVPISSSGSGSIHMKNRTPVGLVIGCAITTDQYFVFNIEGRLIDEMAASIVGDFRF